MRFTIKKVNPFLDFPSDKIPQIFTDKQISQSPRPDPNAYKMTFKNMIAFIEAGVVDPELIPIGVGDKKGKEAGITAEDLFRDPTLGIKLYHAIYEHSLNHFRGLKRVFFSIGIKLSILTMYASDMVSALQVTSLKKEKAA